MSEFKQLSLETDQPSNPVGETPKQGEFYPELRNSPFGLSAKDIRIGRIGLYHARQALEKGSQERKERDRARTADSPFTQWPR